MDVIRQIFSILFVFGLLGLAVWKLRSAGSSRRPAGPRGWLAGPWTRESAKILEPVDRVSLTQQHAVHLVRVRGRELVVATHPQGCSVLAELPDKAGM